MDIKIYRLIEKVLIQKASTNEVHAFNKWLNESETNQETFEQLKLIWQKSGSIYSNYPFDKENAKQQINQHFTTLSDSKPIRKMRKIAYWGAAASVIFLISVYALTFTVGKSSLINYSAYNSVEQIMLPDSTIVWLNKNSSLTLAKNFNKKQRKVTLQGEAFFQVKRNTNKPFKVISGSTVTRVLGTSFNINHNKKTQEIILTVATGKVAFYKRTNFFNKAILLANETGCFNTETKKVMYGTNKNQNYLSWKNKTLQFNETPLKEVCKVLSEHYGETIKTGSQATKLSLTGTFEHESLSYILSTLEITLDVKVDSTQNEIIIN